MQSIGKKSLKFKSDSLFDILSILFPIFYLIIILILTLSIRKTGNYGVETDFFWLYVPHAKSFLEGNIIIDSFHGPIYPVFLALVSLVFKDFFLSGIILSVFSASIVLYFTYRIISILSDRKLAFLVISFLAINPIFIQYSYTCGTDMFFNALVSATIFCFFNQKKTTISRLIATGFLAGITYLTRNNGVFLLMLGLFIFFNSDGISIKRKILYSFSFYSSFILVNLPWNLYCYYINDAFFYNTNYLNVAFEMYNRGTLNRESFWFGENKFQSFWDVISYNPIIFLKTYLLNIYENFRKDIESFLSWQLGIFFIIGVLYKLRTKINHNQTIYIILNTACFLVLAFVFYSERFSLFLIPFYLFFSFLVFFSEDLSLSKIWPKDLVYIVIVVLFIWTFISSIDYNRTMISFGPKDLLKIKAKFEQTIKGNSKNALLASRKPYIAYQLGLQFQVIPLADSFNELIKQLKEKNVKFLYWGSDESNSRRNIKFPVSTDSLKNYGLEILFKLDDKSIFYGFRRDSLH